MDEQSFDDFIKGKLDHYEDPDFDESALAGWKENFSAYQSQPWYVQHRGKLIAITAAILFTLLNGYISSGFFSGTGNTTQLSAKDNLKIDSLTRLIYQLKDQQVLTMSRVDSLHAYYQKIVYKYYQQIELLSAQKAEGQNKLQLNEREQLKNELLVELIRENRIAPDNYKFRYSTPYRREGLNTSISSSGLFENESTNANHKHDYFFHVVEVKPVATPAKTEHAISAKTKNALEKHYFPGLGIHVAPHADLLQAVVSIGKGAMSPRLGVSVDWILSPRLSMETSLDYSTIKYSVNDNFENFNLSEYNEGIGELNSIAITTKLLSLPLQLKYRQWLTSRDQFFIKGGYTPYLSFANRYETTHQLNYLPPGYDMDDATINELEKNDDKKFYGSTFSLGLGMTRSIKKSDKIELGLFYEKSLSSVSPEKINMQLFGVRTAYWFKIR